MSDISPNSEAVTTMQPTKQQLKDAAESACNTAIKALESADIQAFTLFLGHIPYDEGEKYDAWEDTSTEAKKIGKHSQRLYWLLNYYPAHPFDKINPNVIAQLQLALTLCDRLNAVGIDADPFELIVR